LIRKNENCCERSCDPEIYIDQNDQLLSNRKLLISGEINDQIADYINTSLQVLASSDEPVYIYINSPGGEVSAGYSIIDQMELSPFDVVTIVRGQAGSMGAIIAIYGDKRYITRNSTVMIHSMIIENISSDINSCEKIIKHLKKTYDRQINDICKRIKISKSKLLKLLKDTHWMEAEEAIKIGLTHGIWTKEMEKISNDKKKDNT